MGRTHRGHRCPSRGLEPSPLPTTLAGSHPTTSGIVLAAEMWHRIKWEVLNKSACLASHLPVERLSWCLALWDSGGWGGGVFPVPVKLREAVAFQTLLTGPQAMVTALAPQYCCDFPELKETERLGHF